MSEKKSFSTDLIILIGIFLIAIILRTAAINSRPIWYDEAFAVFFSAKGPADMYAGTMLQVDGAAADVHPLTYYSLLWVWMLVFGDSLISVRLLSIFFGVFTILIVYLFGRSLFDRKTALLMTFFAAFSPFIIHYSQEIRMYALLAFALVTATWALWHAINSNRWYWWVLFTLMTALAQYTHNLAVFYLAPLALSPLIFQRKAIYKKLIISISAAIILYLPWLIRLPSQFNKVQQNYWIEKPTLAKIFTTLITYTTNLPVPDRWIPIALFITLFVVAIGIYQTVKSIREKLPGAKRGFWLAYLAFTPAILMFGFSLWKPIFLERALITSGVMFSMWLGWVLSNTIMPRLVRIAVIMLLIVGMVMGIYQHLYYRGFPYGPYIELSQALKARINSGDVILHSNKLSFFPIQYYESDLTQKYMSDPRGSGSDTLALPTQQVLGYLAETSISDAVGVADQVFFIIFSRAIDEYKTAGFDNHPHLVELNHQFAHFSVEEWGDLQLYIYSND